MAALAQTEHLAAGSGASPGSGARATPRQGLAARGLLLAAITAFSILLPALAQAQDISVNFGDNTTLTERAVQLIGLITILAVAPSILIMVTSFTRIVVVLSLLRTALGLQTAPPNSVMISLALFLTFFIMQPTLQQAYDQGIAPLLAGLLYANSPALPFQISLVACVAALALAWWLAPRRDAQTLDATPADVI